MQHQFKVETRNSGRQLVLIKGAQIIDVWPSTGKFFFRSTGEKGRGVPALESVLKVVQAPQAQVIGDACVRCAGPSQVGVHGFRNGEFTSRHYCNKCYVGMYKMGSSKDLKRLSCASED